MTAELPLFAGNGTYDSWKKSTTGGRFISIPDSTSQRTLVDRHSKIMNQLRKDSGLKDDAEVISWVIRRWD